jgi:propanediol dehydratase large subunit
MDSLIDSPAQAVHLSNLDNQPIDINEAASVDYWVHALDTTEYDLRMAVAQVGPAALDVGTQLGRAL